MASNDHGGNSDIGGESEISALGITILDQSTLEKNVEQKVDAVLAHHEHKQKLNILDQEFRQVSADIEKAHKSAAQLDQKLESLQRRVTDPKRHAAAEREAAQRWADVEQLNQRLNKIKAELADIDKLSDGGKPAALVQSSQAQETERERLIRVGEITPFAPDSSLPHKEITTAAGPSPSRHFLGNVQSSSPILARLLKRKKNDSNVNATDANLKHSQVKHKKTKIGDEELSKRCASSFTGETSGVSKPEIVTEIASDDEGSEYLPSDASLSSEELDAEDDDWELDKAKSKKVVVTGKKKKSVKSKTGRISSKNKGKVSKHNVDDSNYELYQKRLKKWKKTQIVDSSKKQDFFDYEVIGHCMKVPRIIWSRLYKYQRTGVQWLWQLHSQDCGGILGDEMGLGKTVQIIAFLAGLQCGGDPSHGPVLIVCPATLLHQWVSHFHLWWPPFRVAVLHRSAGYAGKVGVLMHNIAKDKGVLITSYTGVRSHLDSLLRHNWHYVILDEGHKIRNPDAQITLAVKNFYTPHRLILSGSPIQNSLKELWSLFDFVFPGKLGTLQVFLQQFAVPITHGGFANASRIEVETGYQCAVVLRDTITPYLLRRMKADVKAHLALPEKSEQVLFCALTKEQRSLYQEYLAGDQLSRIMSGKMKVFVGLTNLRKLCNHPDLFTGGIRLCQGETEDDIPRFNTFGWWERSGKMQVVQGVLKVWHKQGHRVLLFTQSSRMLAILEKFVQQQDYTYLKMTGATAVGGRQQLVERFNKDGSIFLFLLTTRVGGLGVNLTGADRVLIYDPDWNPSTDTQARERAWRIGQLNNVTIYRLLTAGTIEEKIYHRQIFKQFLTNRVLKDPKQQRFFKTNDLFELFSLNEGEEEKTESSVLFAGMNSDIVPSNTPLKGKRISNKTRRGCKPLNREKPKKDHNDSKVHLNSDQTRQNCKKLNLISENLPSSNLDLIKKSDEKNSSYSLGSQCERSDEKEVSMLPDSLENFGLMDDESHVTGVSDKPALNIREGLRSTSEETISLPSAMAHCSNTSISMGMNDTSSESASVSKMSSSPEREGSVSLQSVVPAGQFSLGKVDDKPVSDSKATIATSDDTIVALQDGAGENCSVTNDVQDFKCVMLRKEVHSNFNSERPCLDGDHQRDEGVHEPESEPNEEDAKRKKMRMLAKMLSKQMGKSSTSSGTTAITSGDPESSCKPVRKSLKRKSVKEDNPRHDKKTSHSQGRRFEGERINYLVKKRKVKVKRQDKAEESKAEDDYVLSKLFKNSGVHTALSHDAIVNSSDPDYLLLQSEADRVAKEAMKALRASRTQCRTVSLEQQKPHKVRFGFDPKESDDIPMFNDDSSTTSTGEYPEFGCSSFSSEAGGGMMSSSQLLLRMRARNTQFGSGEHGPDDVSEGNAEVAISASANFDSTVSENLDLLSDIRNFVAFQAQVDGRASTSEIITKFRDRLPKEKTHIFKALLKEICDFRKENDGKGIWYIKQEFH